jgi:hypothetical protein
MSSFTHETVRDESKRRLDEIHSQEQRLNYLLNEKEGLEHTLYYDRRPLAGDEYEFYERMLDDIKQQIKDIHDAERSKSDLSSTMSTARVVSLPSFLIRSPPNTRKVLEDPYLFKYVVDKNTGLGGKSRKNRKTKTNRKTNRKTKTNRTGKRSKK